MNAHDYVIRGGLEGRERLRVLARVMHPTSAELFERIEIRPGWRCLDAGCGGGDVTIELARRGAPDGHAVGVDMDAAKIAIARDEAARLGVVNVRFDVSDIEALPDSNDFDLVYARFLLTHLRDPAAAVRACAARLRPGGVFAAEDIDFGGHFTYPASRASERYAELYCATVMRRGGDPTIGPRLPGLLREAGLDAIQVALVQPVAIEGDAKLMNPLTMENIAGPVMEEGLATADEIEGIVRDLYAIAADGTTIAGVPRVFQAWGRKPLISDGR